MKLFEISDSIAKILDMLEEGDADQESCFLLLSDLEMDKEKKALDIAAYLKSLVAQATAIKQEEDRLRDRRKRIDRQIESLREYLNSHLDDRKKYSDQRAEISWRKSTKLEVSCQTEYLPQVYIREKTSMEPDKTALKEALRNGKKIEGCELVEIKNIQIK